MGNIPPKPMAPKAYIPKKALNMATLFVVLSLVILAGVIFTSGFFIGKAYTDRQYQEGTAAGLKELEGRFLAEFNFDSKEEAKEDAMELFQLEQRSSAE